METLEDGMLVGCGKIEMGADLAWGPICLGAQLHSGEGPAGMRYVECGVGAIHIPGVLGSAGG